MRVGMSSAGFYGRMETEEAAVKLTQLPVDACEIFLETHSEYTAAFGELVRRNLAGLDCASVHPKGTQFEPDVFGQSKRQIEDALRAFDGVCEAGEALGARYYVFHGPNSPYRRLKLDDIRRLPENIALLSERAARHGLTILWENVSWCAVRTPEDVRRVRELAPDMEFVLDVKQAYRAETDAFSMIEAMEGRIRHVHALDWDEQGALQLPGLGMTDWRELFRRLRDAGFDGAVMLEPYPWQTMDDEAVRRSLETLREAMA